MRQRVGRQPDERRGEHAVQRGLVARVGERGQPRAEVAHDLPAPVAAPADGHRQQPLVLERALVDGQVAERAQQHDDVLGPVHAGGDELGHALGEQARLGLAPGLRARPHLAEVDVLPAGLVGDQQLDERLARRAARRGPRAARRSPSPEPRRERRVDRVEDRAVRAEVRRQRRDAAVGGELRAQRAEDVDVGVAEAVDRLLLVSHEEQVVAVERAEEVQLQRVGVLQLVDHDALEALGVGAAQRGLAGEQVAGVQLEVVEVQRRAGALGLGVGVGVVAQQLVEQRDGAGRAGVAAGRAVGLERRAVVVAGGALQGVGARAERQLRRAPGRSSPGGVAASRSAQRSRRSRAAHDGLAGAGQRAGRRRGRRDGGLQRRAQRVRVGEPARARQRAGASGRRCAARRGPARSPCAGGRGRRRRRGRAPRRRAGRRAAARARRPRRGRAAGARRPRRAR